ncbi:hypothetical protein, partial [Escherichia coli]|uniref:hypothetical protein n=1 Tax=Escherichia coli TaxID=562 RepID=UPI003BA0A7B2
QRVEFFAQWRDFRPKSPRLDALHIAAPNPFQLCTEAVQWTQSEVHLAGQHRQPGRDRLGEQVFDGGHDPDSNALDVL